LRHVGELVATGLPVLVGTSRKSFVGKIGAGPADVMLPVGDRLESSLATAAWALSQGVQMVRVHDVRPTVQLARLVGSTTRQ
jgi:dihydropteroate synthase